MSTAQTYDTRRALVAQPGGIRDDFDQANETASMCVRRLVRYITDASYIRSYIVANFGRENAPSVDEIRALQAEVQDIWSQTTNDNFQADDALDFAPRASSYYKMASRVARGLPAICEKRQQDRSAQPRPQLEPVTLPTPGSLVTGLEVIAACAQACGFTARMLLGPSRYKHVVAARCLAIAVLFARGNSCEWLANRFSRDHSTILYNAETFFSKHMADPDFQLRWRALCPDGFQDCTTLDEVRSKVTVRK